MSDIEATTPMSRTDTASLRRGEAIAALSMATDLAIGQPVEFALRSCLLADRLGRRLKLDRQTLGDIFYQSLLRYVGCNSETYVLVALFGDEIAFRRDFARIDTGRASEMGALVFAYLRQANQGAGALGMLAGVLRGLVTSKKIGAANIAGHCEVAERLATRLGLPARVCTNLTQLYERWDGAGIPHGLKGEAISMPARVVCLAQDVIVLTAAFGAETARQKLEARRGSLYDPRVVDAYLGANEDLAAGLDAATWDEALALEPLANAELSDDDIDAACLAMADFADLKTPYSVGHSRAVARLAGEAARICGLPPEDVTRLERAGLLHDIGQVGVPARIWLKPDALNDSEREQVRLHTYYSERVLSRSPMFARLGAIVAQHHERNDGSGYHRGERGSALTIHSRILAAAEAYQNKIEPRPHRPAASAKVAAEKLKQEVREGRLDAEAVAAVLAAAGHAGSIRKQLVAGLTEREIDVLKAIARGRSMKEIARLLGISPKTVDNHTQKIYAKIGVKTRGGATLFAIERGLCGGPESAS